MSPQTTKIMIVDDSSFVRRLVQQALTEEPGFQVIGTASNGKEGLVNIAKLNPDVVVLDVEMPEMDGIEMLRELRKTNRKLPVIMFSTLTERGAVATLEALSYGANDYVTKPTNSAGLADSLAEIRKNLASRIHAFCHRPAPMAPAGMRPASPAAAAPPGAQRPAAAAPPRRAFGARPKLIVIGISTGGPPALAQVIPQLPKDLGIPVLIVQHMPPLFTKQLAQSLGQKSTLAVQEGGDSIDILPGQVWIAPGNYHMEVHKTAGRARLRLNQGPLENSCRPAVDVLFRSAAAAFPGEVLAVVMTGMGQDGLKGCEAIKQAQGHVIIQDEASSVVWGMPGAVAKADLADEIVPLGELAAAICRAAGVTLRPSPTGAPARSSV